MTKAATTSTEVTVATITVTEILVHKLIDLGQVFRVKEMRKDSNEHRMFNGHPFHYNTKAAKRKFSYWRSGGKKLEECKWKIEVVNASSPAKAWLDKFLLAQTQFGAEENL